MHPDRESVTGTDVLFTGTLAANARAAVTQLSDGLTVPVLVLELESDRGMHMPLHIEQPFPIGRMDQAEAAARHYRKGARLQVQASALSVRLSCVASHIHTLHDTEPETPACPVSPSSP